MVSNSTPTASPHGEEPSSMQALKSSAGYIVGAIVLALLGYFGWQYIQNAGLNVDTVAADKYTAIEKSNEALGLSADGTTLDTVSAETAQQLNNDVDALVATHGDSIYAWQALMLKAQNAANMDELPLAVTALEEALKIPLNDPGLQAVTQLRYATVLLAQGDIDAAMDAASKEVPTAFEPRQQELLGDIYRMQKDTTAAIRSYNNAWSLLSKRGELRPTLQLKLERLGVSPEPIKPMQMPVVAESTGSAQALVDTLEPETQVVIADEVDMVSNTDNEDNAVNIEDTNTENEGAKTAIVAGTEVE